jgi:hypothetical protein
MQAELLQARGQECPRHTIYLTFNCKGFMRGILLFR